MSNLNQLEPKSVWGYFSQLCDIPRPSKHEEKISLFLESFGKNLGLETIRDQAGNVIIRKPATPGMENRRMVILQGHMDMVPDKAKDSTHDFLKDPIEAYVDGDWIKAKGTTLGADNGIAVAMAMALLAAKDIPHGPIEALFTVDEEAGMNGVRALATNSLKGDILLNLDSEEEGSFYIGCAGGVDTDMVVSYQPEPASAGDPAYQLTVSGLKGGHSGGDIHLGRGNAIKILNRVLWQAQEQFQLRLAAIQGGSPIHNAIARDATAVLTVPATEKEAFLKYVKTFAEAIQQEYTLTDAGLKIDIVETKSPQNVMDKMAQDKLLKILCACPHGVIDMTPDMPELVRTSTNLGHLRMENNQVIIYTLQRSSVDSLRDEVARMVYSIAQLAGVKATWSNVYPGWNPNLNSPIVKVAKEIFQKMYGKTPEVKAIHAGLECGFIGDKYPNLDMISYGAELLHVHSPDEKLNISSTKRIWDLTLEILKNVPVK
ncbi:MAG: cytosol nonspecific dipeptidase [Gammaproteobacteria bacterium GWF2_41_13]|nr:MAG: cytosol nonspecific dipeptidase [Gammaproteobacteria bacterium GWF2_41_13]